MSVHTMGEPEDPKQIFFTNLLLLGFNPISMERKWRIPFNKDMFILPNKKGFETVMHFLFNKLNAVQCREEFRDCWPINDKKQEQQFRKVCHNWLAQIVKEDEKAVFPRIVASVFLSPGGDKFYELLMYFSMHVLLQVAQSQHGVRYRDFLHHPELTSTASGLGDVQDKMSQCGIVRLRTRFLECARQTVSIQEEWKQYTVELVKAFRSLTKATREKERDIKNERQKAADRGLNRTRSSDAHKRRSTVLDYDHDIQSVKRAQKVQRVRDQWRTLECFMSTKEDENEIVESILEGTLEKYCLDAADLNIRVPDLLLRECEQEIHRRGVENIYQGGKLNLLSLIHLCNLCLHLCIERLHQTGVPSFVDAIPAVTTHVHTHNAHLANIQTLRLKLKKEVIPDLKDSIQKLKGRLDTILLRKRSPGSLRTTPTSNKFWQSNHKIFQSLGLGLLPPSPPVSFDPDEARTPQDADGHVTFTHNLQVADDHVSTPEAAAELMRDVGHKIRLHHNSLVQGSPVYGQSVRSTQDTRPPSKLPVRGTLQLESRGNKQRTRFRSAPMGDQSSDSLRPALKKGNHVWQTVAESESVRHPTVDEGSVIRVTSSGTILESLSPQQQKSAKQDLFSQVTKGQVRKNKSRKGSTLKGVDPLVERHVEGAAMPTDNGSLPMGQKQPYLTGQTGAHLTNQNGVTSQVRANHKPQTTNVTPRAQRILADRIAEAVADGNSSECLDYLQDPGAALDAGGFECRDKLKRTPVTAQKAGTWRELLQDSVGPLSSTRVDGSDRTSAAENLESSDRTTATVNKNNPDAVVAKIFSPEQSDTEDNIITLPAPACHHKAVGDISGPDLVRVRATSPLAHGPPSSISSISPRSDVSARRHFDDKRHSTLLHELSGQSCEGPPDSNHGDKTLVDQDEASFLLGESVSVPRQVTPPQTPEHRNSDLQGYVSPFGKTPQQREAAANSLVARVMDDSPCGEGEGLDDLLASLVPANELYQSMLDTKTPCLPTRQRGRTLETEPKDGVTMRVEPKNHSGLWNETLDGNDASDTDMETGVRVIKFQDGSFTEFVDRSPIKKSQVHFDSSIEKKAESPKTKKSSPKKASPLVELQQKLDAKTDNLIARYKQLKETTLTDRSLIDDHRLTEKNVLHGGKAPANLPLIMNTPTQSFLDSYLQTSPALGKYGQQARPDMTQSIVVNKFTLDLDSDSDDGSKTPQHGQARQKIDERRMQELSSPHRTADGITQESPVLAYSPGILDAADIDRGVASLHLGLSSPQERPSATVPNFQMSPYTDLVHCASPSDQRGHAHNLAATNVGSRSSTQTHLPPSPAVGQLVDL